MAKEKYTKKKLSEFEKVILKLRQKALEEMGVIRDNSIDDAANLDSMARDSNYAYHMADVGTDAQEREKAFLWLTRENNFIRFLDEALDRIANGSYGSCIVCEELIPVARLKEVPHTQHCVECKNKDNHN
ncbi:MAG: TraR/DksA C4-type zinc finger protein [Candidatus Marinimicrobia bacterium]|jgi:RNA polymerase-binding transcription factor DksA|nr:TraR/DksA C4-type zinc finger protein [Candidatus Neomarinimicrobiota bacterium]